MTNLMNPPFTVAESQREAHVLISGVTGWKSIQGDFTCPLTPRRSGHYMVQYEAILTDAFGRKRRVALHTNGFEAK